MKMLRERKLIICLLLFTVLFSVCNTTYDTTLCFPFYIDNVKQVDTTKARLSNSNQVLNEYFMEENFLSSVTSFIRVEQTNRLPKKANRIYVNSIFVILFKIAVIPSFTFIIFIFMVCVLFSARLWIMAFIHKSDGKKKKRVFLPI